MRRFLGRRPVFRELFWEVLNRLKKASVPGLACDSHSGEVDAKSNVPSPSGARR